MGRMKWKILKALLSFSGIVYSLKFKHTLLQCLCKQIISSYYYSEFFLTQKEMIRSLKFLKISFLFQLPLVLLYLIISLKGKIKKEDNSNSFNNIPHLFIQPKSTGSLLSSNHWVLCREGGHEAAEGP